MDKFKLAGYRGNSSILYGIPHYFMELFFFHINNGNSIEFGHVLGCSFSSFYMDSLVQKPYSTSWNPNDMGFYYKKNIRKTSAKIDWSLPSENKEIRPMFLRFN